MRIPIVDENDNLVEMKEWQKRKSTEIVRISAPWVTDTEGSILLAQRAFDKQYNPGQWGPAVAGTVEEGETYESNIIKEAEEEIGLKGIEFSLGPRLRRSSEHESFAQVFLAVVPRDYNFLLQKEEVEAVKWFSPQELDKLTKEKPEIFLNFVKEYKDHLK